MAMEIKNNYSSYTARNVESKPPVNSATADYAKDLSKLVPSVDFKVGYGGSSARSGVTLTINPKLLEKMQNDPAQAKETKELLRGVESAMTLINGINKATGWTTVYRHGYIDENGKYHSGARTVKNDAMLKLSDKLRAERRKLADELLERAKEAAAENRNKFNEAGKILDLKA